MGLITPFTAPTDPRWQGSQRFHHIIFLCKNIILHLFILSVIMKYAGVQNAIAEHGTFGATLSISTSFWLCVGLALIPDLIYTFVALALILQKPKFLLEGRYAVLHPGWALTMSIILFYLYSLAVIFNSITNYYDDLGVVFSSAWNNFTWLEITFQSILALCYLGMAVSSIAAVHRWRVGERVAKKSKFVELLDHRDREAGNQNVIQRAKGFCS